MKLAAGPTHSYGLLRRLARDAEQTTLTEALAAERIAQRDAGRTKDFQRGVMAFLAKQEPRFQGD
jgi:2-(1,2-epoxy-1,2-dihydrophenyl)acetyl-CoA isomerase